MNLFLQFDSKTTLKISRPIKSLAGFMTLSIFLGLFLFAGNNAVYAENSVISYDNCDDVTDGGIIAGDETGCDDPVFDPSLITSTTPATGGSNTLEYLWMSTTDNPNGVAAIWNIIPGSSGETFDPGPITQTTYYRRCARRVGCTVWVIESNTVVKEIECTPPCDLEISNIVGVNPMCNPGNTGIVALSITGGTAPYTYTWSNGDTSQDITNLGPGEYCVTVTDANGCIDIDCVTLIAPDPIVESVQLTHSTCGQYNGGIDLSVSGGMAPYTYFWNNGSTSEDLYNLGAGTYCVEITDSKGCKINTCYVINDSGNNSVSITPAHTNICPGESVTLTASGTGNFTWSASAGNLSNTTGQSTTYTMGMNGTYTITVQATDANGCTATSSATVTVNPSITVGGYPTDASCGEHNGSVTSSVSGGAMPYTYSWNNGATTPNLMNLGAGQYCVTVTDANGCINSNCYYVGETSNNIVSVSPNSSSVCSGEAVVLTASGSATNNYTWSASAGNLSNTTGQSTTYTMGMTGTYTITVHATDANGCTASSSATVTVNPSINVGGYPTNATCGESNGSVTSAISGGAMPYTYAWSNGASSSNLMNLDNGQYCLTVTDANGCTNSNCFNVGETGANQVSISPSNTTACEGELVSLSASAGFTSYSWSASNGSFNSTNSQSVIYNSSLTLGVQTITLQATDSNGCISYATATIIVNPTFEIVDIPRFTTCGENNGSLAPTLTGGIAPLSYLWENGSTVPNRINLAAGQYCLTVTDANGCTANECFIINEIPAPEITLSATNPSCTALGSISTSVAGGTMPYFYTWNTGQSSPNISGLQAGQYCVTLEDSNGCTNVKCVTLTSQEQISISGTTQNPTCGVANGSISVNATNGVSATFAWSNGAAGPNLQNLSVGTYTVSATSNSGCTAVETFVLQNEGTLGITVTSTNPICAGDSNGLVSVSNTYTGSGTLSYLWSNGATTSSVSNLAAGSYCVTVSSTDGCVETACVDIVDPNAIQITEQVVNNSCGLSNGSITVSANGGNAPYTYAWSNNENGNQISNLNAGNYCITITDANGCTATECYTLDPSTTPLVSFSNPGAGCDEIGGLTANVTGGTAPYTYLWTNGQTTATINNLIAGTYCVVVTDANACSIDICTNVSVDQSPNINGVTQDPTCGSANGSINLNVTNVLVTTYAWSNGASTSNLQNLNAGTYTVTVTAESGCTSTASYTLTSQGELTVSLDPMNPICEGADNGMVTASTNFTGTGSLTYSWSNGATTSKISDLAAGQYCVTVTSTDGCNATACTTLTAPTAVVADAIIGAAGCEQATGNIKLNIYGGTAPYTYKWDTGATTKDIEGLAVGTYCVTICDALGCVFTDCFDVNGGVNYTASIASQPLTCNGDNDASAEATANGGSSPYTYVWNTGATTALINNLSAGDYCVTITDLYGCNATTCVTIEDPAPTTVTASSTNTTCNESNGSATITSNTSGSSILWSNGATTTSIQNLAAGTYSVTLTNNQGCTATTSVTVSNSSDISVTVNPSNSTICPGESVNLTSSTSQTNGVTYSWTVSGGTLSSTNTSTTSYTMMVAGTYIVTLNVSDANGCTSSDQASITVLDPNDPICNPTNDLVNIGDYVWFDINNNGIQDDGELGVEGIKVKLLTAGPDGEFYTADDVMIDMETTNASGYYLFEDVAAGDYIIMFCLDLPGTEYTSQNTGGNDLIDSDANPNNGKTDPFTVVAGQDDDLSFDAGIILTPTGCDNLTDGGDICCDQIVCGAGTVPELISNITMPSGGSGNIEWLWMSSTVNGVFDMDTWNVIVGANGPDYQPGGITQTTYITRCSRREGCDTYKESNIIKLEVKPSPTATIESLPAYICVGESDNFNATNAGAAVTYTWNLGAGASPATATGQYLTNVSWNTAGTKTITLTTTNLFCTYTHTRTVEVGNCLIQDNERFITVAATPVPNKLEVELNWNTNPDMNDYKFLIEQSSDGENYNVIYTMDGNDAFESKAYSYKDVEARQGRNYYRVKHINNSGKTENSEFVVAMIDDFQSEKFIVFPNPTQDYVIFESLKLTDKEGAIMISDMKGTILERIVIPANTTRKLVDISNYPPGNYTFYIKYHNVRSIPTIINKMER